LGACHNKRQYRQHTVRTQDQAASVTLSPTLVAHWDDYVEALRPNFTLKDGDEALKKVLPRTMAVEEKLLRMFGASLGISARANEKPKDSNNSTSSGSSATTATSTATTASASDGDDKDEEDAKSNGDSAVERPSASKLPGLTPEQLSVGQDPMLEYLAATALYQEVQLLNRYITDAALRRDHEPYVVRLQIGVTPYARNMPYDVYATLAFFGRGSDAPSKVPIDETRYSPNKPPQLPRQYPGQTLTPVLVAPMLVTDNLEGALKSRTVNTIRDLTLALSVLTGKVDVDSKLSSYTDNLTRVLGTDLNSLLTVAQVNDNSIRVRLGAARQATAEHATIPRTHNVTLLVLVPRSHEGDRLHVEAATELRHASTGYTLRSPSQKSRTKEVHSRLKRYSAYVYPTSPEWAHYCYERLKSFQLHEYDTWTASADFESFQQALYTACETTTDGANLWMELVELSGSRPYAQASFELPEQLDPRLPEPVDQLIILEDNKTTGKMTATLRGGKELKAEDLFATLAIDVEEKQEPQDCEASPGSDDAESSEPTRYRLVLAATDIGLSRGGRASLKLTFPSLAKQDLGVAKQDPGTPQDTTGELTIEFVEDSPWKADPKVRSRDHAKPCESERKWPSFDNKEARSQDRTDCRVYKKVKYVKPEESEQKASFAMASGVQVIRADKDGNGTLKVRLSTAKDALNVQIEVAGGQVGTLESTSSVTTFPGRDVIAVKKGAHSRVTLNLENLSANAPAKVTAYKLEKGEKVTGEKVELTFAVEPIPPHRAPVCQ